MAQKASLNLNSETPPPPAPKEPIGVGRVERTPERATGVFRGLLLTIPLGVLLWIVLILLVYGVYRMFTR